MPAGKYDIYVEQGATFELTVTVDVSLSGYYAVGEIRKGALDPTVIRRFTFETISENKIKVILSADSTKSIPTTGRSYSDYTVYYYDINLINSEGHVIRLLNGDVKVSPGITKNV